jgi:hypothetical protein
MRTFGVLKSRFLVALLEHVSIPMLDVKYVSDIDSEMGNYLLLGGGVPELTRITIESGMGDFALMGTNCGDGAHVNYRSCAGYV